MTEPHSIYIKFHNSLEFSPYLANGAGISFENDMEHWYISKELATNYLVIKIIDLKFIAHKTSEIFNIYVNILDNSTFYMCVHIQYISF